MDSITTRGKLDVCEMWSSRLVDRLFGDSDWRFDGLSGGHRQSQVKNIRQVRLFTCLACSVKR